MSEGVGIDEFQARVEEALGEQPVRPEPQPVSPPKRTEGDLRDRFMIGKLIAAAFFVVVVLIALFESFGIGAFGAACGLIVSVVMAMTTRKRSDPVLFDIDRALRRK